MKTLNLAMLLAANLVMELGLPAVAQQPQAKRDGKPQLRSMQLRLKELQTHGSKKSPLLKVVATVEANKSQDSANGGIKLVIRIRNTGDKPVNIVNPLDFLKLSLSDERGQTILLPPSGSPDAFRANRNSKMPRFPFKVLRVLLNKQLVPDQEVFGSTLLLPNKSQLTIEAEIDRIVVIEPAVEAQQGVEAKPASLSIVKIPAGQYRLQVILLMATSADRKINRLLMSDPLEISLLDETTNNETPSTNQK